MGKMKELMMMQEEAQTLTDGVLLGEFRRRFDSTVIYDLETETLLNSIGELRVKVWLNNKREEAKNNYWENGDTGDI